MNASEESSRSLSAASVERLLESHRQFFLAFLQQRVESRVVAEDILQSAFVRGLEHGSELRDEESVVAWFYRVLRNAVIDHYRHRSASARAMETWGREFTERQEPDAALQQEIC